MPSCQVSFFSTGQNCTNIFQFSVHRSTALVCLEVMALHTLHCVIQISHYVVVLFQFIKSLTQVWRSYLALLVKQQIYILLTAQTSSDSWTTCYYTCPANLFIFTLKYTTPKKYAAFTFTVHIHPTYSYLCKRATQMVSFSHVKNIIFILIIHFNICPREKSIFSICLSCWHFKRARKAQGCI